VNERDELVEIKRLVHHRHGSVDLRRQFVAGHHHHGDGGDIRVRRLRSQEIVTGVAIGQPERFRLASWHPKRVRNGIEELL